ncbi:hypothetical protein EON80_23480 [bacterium]|nr:MAG: hypothetical protein EON80_23480 [bacterium]
MPTEIPTIVGANWEQIRSIARFWPHLDSEVLHNEFQSDEPPATVTAKIYRTASHCLYLLPSSMIYEEDAVRKKHGEEAWPDYVHFSPEEALSAYQKWREVHWPVSH